MRADIICAVCTNGGITLSKKDKEKKKDKKEKKSRKTYIFVDSENVGNLIPTHVPAGCEVYFFLSDVNVYRKVYRLLDEPNFHVVDVLETDNERKREKNEMDLAIIAFVGSLIQNGLKKKDTCIILSFDKGYDRAISLLQQENPKLNLRREEMSLRQYIDNIPDPRKGSVFKGSLPRNPLLRKRATECADWDSYRKGLSTAQKKSLRMDQAKNEESGAVCWFEYDFYDDKYQLYSSGTLAGTFDSLEQGKTDYDQVLSKPKKKRKMWHRPKKKKPSSKA